jgi:hypothetical protein
LKITRVFPEGAHLVCPLTLGGHVDHRLTRSVAEKLNIPLWYYADYPYVLDIDEPPEMDDWELTLSTISPGGLLAWQASVAAHGSQISTFWPDLKTMRTEIQAYFNQMGGVRLWQKP